MVVYLSLMLYTKVGHPRVTIGRLRMVKNINFFWDSKKLFLTHLKTVFWVTEHFSIK